MVKARRKTTNF